LTAETKPTWGGPTAETPVGRLAACILCRRLVTHDWAEHIAQVEAVADPLAKAAGLPAGDAA
jgi:hypothetical protein